MISKRYFFHLSFAMSVSALIVGTFFVSGCASNSSTEDRKAELEETADSNAWYNKSYLRPIFGDFDKVERVVLPDSRETLKSRDRGAYLARNVAACGSCHGLKAGDPDSPLVGGRLMEDGFGSVRASNITPDEETGVGRWNVFELMRAIRSSIDREGRPLSIELHRPFRWMSDQDAKAIALYILSLPPQKSAVERRRLGGFERNRWGLFPQHSAVAGYVPDLHPEVSASRGWYLANNVAQCQMCHSGVSGDFKGYTQSGGLVSLFHAVVDALSPTGEQLDEGVSQYLTPEGRKAYEEDMLRREAEREGRAVTKPESKEQRIASIYDEALDTGNFPVGGPDIRGGVADSGLSAWSEDEIVNYLNTGRSKGGEVREGRFCPWPFYRGMNTEDKRSIALYLKRLQ